MKKLYPVLALAAMLFVGVLSMSAQARVSLCPANQFLLGEGDDAECVDISTSIVAMCPQGQVLRGIAYGKPVCEAGARAMTAGQYQWSGAGLCRYPNPLTKSCTCPEGYTAIPSMETYEPRCTYKLKDENNKKIKSCAETQYTCYAMESKND